MGNSVKGTREFVQSGDEYKDTNNETAATQPPDKQGSDRGSNKGETAKESGEDVNSTVRSHDSKVAGIDAKKDVPDKQGHDRGSNNGDTAKPIDVDGNSVVRSPKPSVTRVNGNRDDAIDETNRSRLVASEKPIAMKIGIDVETDAVKEDTKGNVVLQGQTKDRRKLKDQKKPVNAKRDSLKKSMTEKNSATLNRTKTASQPKPEIDVNVKPIDVLLNDDENKTESQIGETVKTSRELKHKINVNDELVSLHFTNTKLQSKIGKTDEATSEKISQIGSHNDRKFNESRKNDKQEGTPKLDILSAVTTGVVGKIDHSSLSVSQAVSVKTPKKKTTDWNKQRAQSEPARLRTPQAKPRTETLNEERNDRKADSRMTQFSDQLIETESVNSAVENDGDEYELSESLRSTALDSRLFDSQSSIVTHTSIDNQKPARIYRENRQKLKEGLYKLYNSYSNTAQESPLLPKSDDPRDNGHHYWPPWMTVTGQIVTEADFDLVDDSTVIDEVDTNNYEIEKSIDQFHHLFHREGQEIKCVYIVGKSGSGKTAFCRHLVKQWCLQHQQKTRINDSKENLLPGSTHDSGECRHDTPAVNRNSNEMNESINSETKEDESENRVKDNNPELNENSGMDSESDKAFSDCEELSRFEFLFYIPLFFKTNHNHIHDLIKTQFKSIFNEMVIDETDKLANSTHSKGATFLDTLLDKESDKCLIVLDGADVWRPFKKKYKSHVPVSNLPEKDPSKAYTVILTTTPEHMVKIGHIATDSDLEVTLNGMEESTSVDLINNTLERLNSFYGTKKKPSKMMLEMDYWKTENYQRLPFTLQSLVCLWYFSGEIGNTLCDIYSRMLELLFKRLNDVITDAANTKRKATVPNKVSHSKDDDNDVQLPRYFIRLINCQKNKVLIFTLGKIAWETRMQSIKSFDSSRLESFGFSLDEVSKLIVVGVLTQNKVPGFSEVLHGKTVFFPDERLQEFWATTYVVILCRNKAYENMGQIEVHTGQINSVVDAHYTFFTSIEKVLQFSNLVVFLCGLLPPTIEHMTQKINDLVSADKKVLEFRANLETESEDNVSEDIQQLVMRCAHEALFVNTNNILIHVADVSFGDFDSNYLSYVAPEEVRSVTFDTATSADETYVSKFIHQTRVFNRLQKLLVKDLTAQLTLQDVDSIHILSERCATTLNVVSFVFSNTNRIMYQRITHDLDRLLPNMPNLLELELIGIKLSHERFGSLAYILSNLTHLTRLQLKDITCDMTRCDGEEHVIDFSQLEDLEYIDVDGRDLPIVAVNRQRLTTCVLGNLPQGPELQIFASLRKAKCLKHFTQKVRQRPPFISQTLIKTLNTWQALELLNLNGVNFGEYSLIIKKQMKNLSDIRLVETRMSRIAWCRFVDCLPDMEQEVVIVTRDIQVTPIEVDVTRDPLRRPIDAETRAMMLARETETHIAFDYVREKSNVFCVLFDFQGMFDFTKEENKSKA